MSDRRRAWIRRGSQERTVADSIAATGESADRVAALGALYQADRQDAVGNLVAALALIAAGLTYVGVVAVLINNVKLPGGPWALAFLAFPLWVVASFHALLTANSVVRARSIEIIERPLVRAAGFDDSVRQYIGSRAGQRVMNIKEQPRRLWPQTLISYGGVLVVIIAFSFYCLDVAAKIEGWGSAAAITAEIIYALLFVAVLMAWSEVFRLAGEVAKEPDKDMR
jgi:hypothetical protein